MGRLEDRLLTKFIWGIDYLLIGIMASTKLEGTETYMFMPEINHPIREYIGLASALFGSILWGMVSYQSMKRRME